MRKGLTLIELIFTIVIIAMVFTVIPKVMYSLNKSDSFVIRQDAMFNGVSMTNMISKLPWDENNREEIDILGTDNDMMGDLNLTCSSDKRRIGGFIGARNCENDFNASNIIKNPSQNDIDDFDDTNESAGYYLLDINVAYINADINYTNVDMDKVLIDLNKSNTGLPITTNLKHITVNIDYNGTKVRMRGKRITQFGYTSSNIGQMKFYKRNW